MNRKHMSKTELERVLELHKRWLYGEGGIRADLTGYDLTGVDLRHVILTKAILTRTIFTEAILIGAVLRDADLTDAIVTGAVLRGAILTGAILRSAILTDTILEGIEFNYCVGNNEEIKSMQIGTYLISYHKDTLNIGCETHTVSEWEEFSDEDILEMDGAKALKWWKLNKEIVLTLVKRET